MAITLITTVPGSHLQSPSLSIISSPITLVCSWKSPQSLAFPDLSPILPFPTPVSSTFQHHVSSNNTSPATPSPRIPPELFLDIISFLAVPDTPTTTDIYDHSDLAEICNCSLVGRFWLHAAREHLWKYVRLGDGRRGNSFVKLLQHYTSGHGSTLPGFSPHVKHLFIRESRGGLSWDRKWLNEVLPTLAGSLLNLHSLEVERITWEYLSSKSRDAFMKGFKGVRKLALRVCEFRTTLDMIRFIGEFEDVESLALDGVRCEWDDIPAEAFVSKTYDRAVPEPPRKLRELAMRGTRTRQALKWMMAAMRRDRGRVMVEVLRLGALGVKSAPAVGKFLKMLGASLKELHLGFDAAFIDDGDEIVSHIDLSHNNALREMHVYGLVIPSLPPPDLSDLDPPPPPPQLMPLTALLDRVHAPLRALSLALHPADLHALSSMDFDGLARVLDREPWATLEDVQVVVANEDDGQMGRIVNKRLDRLFERGVLRVDVGFDDREVV
ncbi:hypothetical protein DEU56DRAFT_948272 [Suillus clintonianus]|uniref:uncharacterized protein n=1 Tax=Suillus clintonianus TaxID=1904413 RepID=UPI001B87EE99|nr:uncharacterized protein DEU56DRAFT_948272 [Suillus clintonianus]KAG2154815.1 hypothetical protein DEU56DRAFT_948272 [Suillus clintonianus]